MALFMEAFPGLSPRDYWALEPDELAALSRRLQRRG